MRARRELVAVLGLAVLLRLAVLLAAAGSPQRYWSQDDRDYIGLAFHLHAGYFGDSGYWFDRGLLRTPVFPFTLRAIFDIFGTHYVAVVAFNALVGTATAFLTYRLARLLLPDRYALGAAFLVAIDPASIVFSNLMLTETLFAFLLTAALLLLVLGLEREQAWPAAAAGVVLGVGILTRPVAEYLPLVLGLILYATRRRVAVVLAAALVAGAAIPAGAWAIRNHAKTGVATISTIDGHNMLNFRAYGALRESGWSKRRATRYIAAELASRTHPGENAAQISKTQLSLGVHILLQHPTGAFKSWARGEGKLLVGPAKTETATLLTGREQVRGAWLHALIGLNAAITIAVLALAVAGVATARSFELWILIAAAAYLIVISGGPEAYSRFRVPVTPVLAILAATGGRALLEKTRRRALLGRPVAAPDIRGRGQQPPRTSDQPG
jgi:4-amino-4-deoxy-L-arabinose transferase-like glycosyltransferase